MLTAASLREYTHKDLAQMAKKRGVRGWHSMRKDELVRSLVRAAKSEATSRSSSPGRSKATNGKRRVAANGKSRNGQPAKAKSNKSTAAQRRIRQARDEQQRLKDLSMDDGGDGSTVKDRAILMVRDSFWLQAYWELSRKSIERAQAAMASCTGA